MSGPIDLVERTIRAERLALDMARVVAAVQAWRLRQQHHIPSRPIVRSLVDEFDMMAKAHPHWRQDVREMGEDVDEYPLEALG